MRHQVGGVDRAAGAVVAGFVQGLLAITGAALPVKAGPVVWAR